MARFIDLSQEIYQGMPVYQGHLKTVIWTHATHEETARNFDGGFSFTSNGVLLCDHGPTHVDAIKHLDPSPDALAIDQMALDVFYGPATCIDVSHAGPHQYITREDIEMAVERDHVGVRPGDIVLFCTGTFSRLAGTPRYSFDYPGLDESASEWIVEQAIKTFGVDSPSPDNPISKTYPVHMMCRRQGMTHFENLANLEQVIGKRFTFVGFPLKFRNGTGSPVRAVAIFDM